MNALNHAKGIAKALNSGTRKPKVIFMAAVFTSLSLIGQPCFGQMFSDLPRGDARPTPGEEDNVVSTDLDWLRNWANYLLGLRVVSQVREDVSDKALAQLRSHKGAVNNHAAISQAPQASAQQGAQVSVQQARFSSNAYNFPPGQLRAYILRLFANLPGQKAVNFLAPDLPVKGPAPGFLVVLNGQQRLFSASANKVFILCERLRQLDSPNVAGQLDAHELPLDQNVWSLGSTIFNPPDLSGLVSEKTAMEAMIVHSDNTATDMILKQAGPNQVRQFIDGAGLSNTLIPDSTRALFAYVQGAPNYLTISWNEVLTFLNRNSVHPLLNDVETLASSANDLVSFYERALQGGFFRNQETLTEFRRILALGDINYLVGFPLGVNAFGKAGYFDSLGTHGRCIAGGMFTANRWVYFAAIINWDAASLTDPATEAAFYDALRKAIAAVQIELGR
jgi:beta-lactamase class A